MSNNDSLLDALQEAAATIDSLLDYICESNAIQMAGAREECSKARDVMSRLYALDDAFGEAA